VEAEGASKADPNLRAAPCRLAARFLGLAMIAPTPQPPYYAVIFTAQRTEIDDGYDATAKLMLRLAAEQPGFLGVEHARDGLGITVSYWADEAAIAAWKAQADHQLAQRHGRAKWYSTFSIRVARVERAYGFTSPP